MHQVKDENRARYKGHAMMLLAHERPPIQNDHDMADWADAVGKLADHMALEDMRHASGRIILTKIFDLNSETREALKEQGIERLNELAELPLNEIRSIPGMDDEILEQLTESLERRGFLIKDER